jgi:hypothetical protein
MWQGADEDGPRGVLRTIEGGDPRLLVPRLRGDARRLPGWTFDGNYDRPTFSPSVLVTSGCKTPQFKPGDECWCTFNAEAVQAGREPSGFECSRCHLFVKAGKIEFLSDSTHKLAGQTVEMQAPP